MASKSKERQEMELKTAKTRFGVMEPYIKGMSVLDIGCVDSRPGGERKYRSTGLHMFLKERAARCVGVDTDKDGVEEMNAQGFECIANDCETMRLGEEFDCVVAGEVIEHLSNPGLFLENVKGHLKSGGAFVLTTSNAFSIVHFYRILTRNRIKVHGEHTAWYDPMTIAQLLARHGFRVEAVWFANKTKWREMKNIFKIKYQVPRFISWLRPYYSGTIIVVARAESSGERR